MWRFHTDAGQRQAASGAAIATAGALAHTIPPAATAICEVVIVVVEMGLDFGG